MVPVKHGEGASTVRRGEGSAKEDGRGDSDRDRSKAARAHVASYGDEVLGAMAGCTWSIDPD